jgi:hypothetical protein
LGFSFATEVFLLEKLGENEVCYRQVPQARTLLYALAYGQRAQL